MNITGQGGDNKGSLRELYSNTLEELRNAEGNNYLTAKIRGKIKVITANRRGFTVGLDYSTNPTGGYMDPAGGNLVSTYKPQLDRLTGNYQYVQFGEEIDNENLANSKSDLHVGAGAKALADVKMMNRRLEFEEYYFCRGDGYQTMARITTGGIIAGGATGTIVCSGAVDGLGTYMLRVGQVIRIYGADNTTLKGTGTILTKQSNTTITANFPAGVTTVAGDLVYPQGDATTPTVVGVKGLPYLVRDGSSGSAAYFDKSLTTVPSLQAIVDSSSTTLTRTAMEILYRRHNSIRNGGSTKTIAVTSPAQMSAYFQAFFAQSGAQVHITAGGKANVDIGAGMDYTAWGQPIHEYQFILPNAWYNLDLSSFVRLTLKDAGPMLTPAGEFVQKISGGAYANAQQRWDDDYLEYMSANPAKNSAMTNLSTTGLPTLVGNPYTGS